MGASWPSGGHYSLVSISVLWHCYDPQNLPQGVCALGMQLVSQRVLAAWGCKTLWVVTGSYLFLNMSLDARGEDFYLFIYLFGYKNKNSTGMHLLGNDCIYFEQQHIHPNPQSKLQESTVSTILQVWFSKHLYCLPLWIIPLASVKKHAVANL